jgi:hypothetical protein
VLRTLIRCLVVVAALAPVAPATARAADPLGDLAREADRMRPAPDRRRPSPPPTTALRVTNVTEMLPYPWLRATYFGGTWVDLDGDDDLDFTMPVDSDSGQVLAVWRNDGDRFTDIAAEIGLGGIERGRAAVWLDLDDDGDLDLYLTRRSDAPSNLLFENIGGRMVERDAGPILGQATDVSQAWADFDQDGDLDLFLPGIVVSRSRLMRNDGPFRFTDVTQAVGLDTLTEGYTAVWSDADDDGDADLAIGGPWGFTYWRNLGGHFRDETGDMSNVLALLASPAFGDIDFDGDVDLRVGGFFPPRNFENVRDPGSDPEQFFVYGSPHWGVGAPWGVGGTWADVDFDGDLDLLDDAGSAGMALVENRVPQGGQLVDVSESVGLPYLPGISWHPVAGDFDADGDLDWFAPAEYEPRLYRNDTTPAGGALHLRLAPRRGGVPVGARVRLELDGRVQVRDVAWPGNGFAFPAPEVHLATGAHPRVPEVEVTWADGERELFHSLRAGRVETLVQGRGKKPDRGRGRGLGRHVAEATAPVPAGIALSCNPCREPVRIAASPASANARVIDLRGRVVREIDLAAGGGAWDLRDHAGRRVPAGVYWIRTGAAAARRVVVLP